MIPLDPEVMRKLRSDKERKHTALVMKQPVMVVPPPTTEPLRGYRTELLPRAKRLQWLHVDADTPAFMRCAIKDAFCNNRQFDWV